MWKKTEDDGTSTQLWKGNIANGTAYAMVVLNATPKDQTVNVSMYDFFIDEVCVLLLYRSAREFPSSQRGL